MLYLGIDVGNFDTKSQNTTVASGYEGPLDTKPMIANHVLEFNGKFYTPSIERLYYVQDKTSDERGIVLVLISIAMELIHRYGKNSASKAEIQDSIFKVSAIALGVGLPVSHYKKMHIDKLVNYYSDYMSNQIAFTYDGYKFLFQMKHICVYPQGGAAAMCDGNKIATTYKTYYVIDIGGYTVDVAQFKDGMVSKDVFTLELGIIILYDSIIDKVYKDTDTYIDYDIIESVLDEEKTILSENVISIINAMASKHAVTIINALRQKNVKFDSYPCLFVGGGSLRLQKYILENSLIKRDFTQFIKDTRANAKGYARLIRDDIRAEQQMKG